jgi:DNA-binding NtrC family response regulator
MQPMESGSLKEIATAAAGSAERRAICAALRAASGNKSAAARALKTDYKTLHVKIKTLGIHRRDWDPEMVPPG